MTEARAPAMSDLAAITFTATIMKDGTITLGPIAPTDFERAREHIMSIMGEVAGGNPVVEVECMEPGEVDAITERLAKALLGGAS